MRKDFQIQRRVFMRLWVLLALTFIICAACAPAQIATDEWSGTIYVEHADDYLNLYSPYGHRQIRYRSVQEVVYTKDWEPGVLIEGIENDSILSGIFEKEGMTYELHAYKGVQGYISLIYNVSNVLVFNLESMDDILPCKDEIANRAFAPLEG